MQRPNKPELTYLNLAYNKFYDIFDEIINDDFWQNKAEYRFGKIREAFAIYAELLNYEPLQRVIEHIHQHRPPMEAEISSDVFKLIRNIFAHFPFFDSWDEVYVSHELANWHKPGQSIDKFLTKYEGHEPVKYRFWQADIKKMTYVSINFPKNYTAHEQVYLHDILAEREGVKFSLILMQNIINTQVESVRELPHDLKS